MSDNERIKTRSYSRLRQLKDVDLSNPTDDDLLVYDSSVDKYVLKSAADLGLGGGGGGGISEVSEDTSPTLGGNLDVSTFTVGDADAADLTKLSQLTATATELNYVDGVTSAIQTQINSISSTVSGKLANIVEDTTPQLGGTLDVNGQLIGDLKIGTLTMSQGSTATASGSVGCFAQGTNATASAGQGSFAMGQDVTSSGGQGSFALGQKSTASGTKGSFALGWYSTASGQGSFAIGNTNTASGVQGSFAAGQQCKSTGSYGSFAIGNGATSSGNSASFAIGDAVTASGAQGCFAAGAGFVVDPGPVLVRTSATGSNGCFAMGSVAVASGDNGCFAMGSDARNHADESIVLGSNVINNTNGAIRTGKGSALMLWRSAEVNFKTVAQTQIVTIGSGDRILIDSVEIITTSISSPGTAPTVTFGDTGDADSVLTSTVSGSNAANSRYIIEQPKDMKAGAVSLTANITVASTATAHSGYFVIKGYII